MSISPRLIIVILDTVANKFCCVKIELLTGTIYTTVVWDFCNMKDVHFLSYNTEGLCVFTCLLGLQCVSTAKHCVSRNTESLILV